MKIIFTQGKKHHIFLGEVHSLLNKFDQTSNGGISLDINVNGSMLKKLVNDVNAEI